MVDLNLTIILISIVAPIGAIDVFYYHIYKFKLASRPESWAETWTHILRSYLLGIGTLFLVFVKPQGIWFWIIGFIFVLDFINNLVDGYLEYQSRKGDGGLPQIEYMVHIAGATGMGTIAISYFFLAWEQKDLANELVPVGNSIHHLLRINLFLIAVGSFLLGTYELVVMQLSKSKLRQNS